MLVWKILLGPVLNSISCVKEISGQAIQRTPIFSEAVLQTLKS